MRSFKNKFLIKIKSFHRFVLDILFPISCLKCQEYGKWLCDQCLREIKTCTEQICPICEKVFTPDGKTCLTCRKKTSLDGLLVCASYQEKIIPKIIHAFKYKFILNLQYPLGEIMTRAILSSNLPLADFIIPIPLHSKRMRWRGFNQSLLLAEYIGKNITPGIKVPILSDALYRNKNTSSQMKIKNYQKRKENIFNAFSVINKKAVERKNIFLIDDIATTGATLFECASILKKAGAKKVFAIVIARQEIR